MTFKLKNFLSKSAYVIYIVLFGYIFYITAFRNSAFEYNNAILFSNIFKISAFLAVFLLIYSKCNKILYKYRYLLLGIAVLWIFYVQLSVSSQMIPRVVDDLANVQRGAILYVTGENPEELVILSLHLVI